ncbi:unnamed protein product [Acanthosepion pharaonis]|uniref:Uncharacterized protein n=1 Tax=Acanthosepion pharaonis TaxID=158019 RepID=A0A812C4B5_ACAPH|nr:unnamed protein product [Sepia pharaonis]
MRINQLGLLTGHYPATRCTINVVSFFFLLSFLLPVSPSLFIPNNFFSLFPHPFLHLSFPSISSFFLLLTSFFFTPSSHQFPLSFLSPSFPSLLLPPHHFFFSSSFYQFFSCFIPLSNFSFSFIQQFLFSFIPLIFFHSLFFLSNFIFHFFFPIFSYRLSSMSFISPFSLLPTHFPRFFNTPIFLLYFILPTFLLSFFFLHPISSLFLPSISQLSSSGDKICFFRCDGDCPCYNTKTGTFETAYIPSFHLSPTSSFPSLLF